jgi:hypothetical protein
MGGDIVAQLGYHEQVEVTSRSGLSLGRRPEQVNGLRMTGLYDPVPHAPDERVVNGRQRCVTHRFWWACYSSNSISIPFSIKTSPAHEGRIHIVLPRTPSHANQGLKNHVTAGGLKEDAPTSL